MLWSTCTLNATNANPTTGAATSGSVCALNVNNTTAGSVGPDLYSPCSSMATLLVQLTGTWTGAVTIQGSNDGVNWYGLEAFNASTGTGAATIPSATPGLFFATTYGAMKLRVAANATLTGSIVVSAIAKSLS